MRVLQATEKGMCFGVKDALELVFRLDQPHRVTIHGQLVHNPVVSRALDARGFRTRTEEDRDGGGDVDRLLITAHGISDRERKRLAEGATEVIDTTCPLVSRVHRVAGRLATEGWFVVVLGKHGHVEVKGITGDLDRHAVVSACEDVRDWAVDRIAVICQTTMMVDRARTLLQRVQDMNPGATIRFQDTICDPTRQRILALDALLPKVQAMVVVGGHNSNNTTQLVERCRSAGLPTFHVEVRDELPRKELAGFEVVGLTAGTSTLDTTIAEVHAALLAIPSLGEARLLQVGPRRNPDRR